MIRKHTGTKFLLQLDSYRLEVINKSRLPGLTILQTSYPLEVWVTEKHC